jgi:hypothetical protein
MKGGNMKEQRMESTQIRIPQNVFNEIRLQSSKAGISQNAFMLILFQLGMKVYSGECIIRIQDE